MSRLKTEFFIARRLSSREAGRGGAMVRIAAVTVGVGMAVMIVALAVIYGFKKEMTQRLTGFTGRVEVVSAAGEGLPITRTNQVAGRPFALLGGMTMGRDAMQGVMLKGVEQIPDFFRGALTEGLPPAMDGVRKPEILLSRTLADVLEMGVDDRVEMLFVQEGMSPRRYMMRIAGIYHTGLAEMDNRMVLTDLRNVQHLARLDSMQITGYELDEMPSSVPEGLRATTVEERFPQLFDWLRAHDVNAAVIITIMIAVAFLNMGAALLIILLEKTRMIGLLKALGMTDGALRLVFVLRSAAIVLRGMVWGNAIGLGLCFMQRATGLVRLNATGYFLSEVPISLGAGWLIALNLGAFSLLLLLLIIPTLIISRISPATTIRYQ